MLHGRVTERAALAALIDEAWASRGGALVLRGLPGVGKSALLADAVVHAEGMLVLRASGIESESPLAFAALHRLLRPAMRAAGRLPAPQARALRAAFGEEEGDGGDRFLVFLAALSLLAEAAEHTPVLAVIDDAHWLDAASAEALLFVARRVQAERVALLFAAREGDVRRFDSDDVPALVVEGLDRGAVAALLSERAGVPVPADVSDRLARSTGGNPLALIELPDALTTDQLGGMSPLPAQLPLTEGVERVFLDRARRLSEQAQSFLLVAAADDSGRLPTVCQAALALDAGEEALDEVERSGLLRTRGTRLELRHPLVRSAVYTAGTSSRRRQAHRALAGAMAAEQDTDRRAWHLAASVVEPDEAVVAELDGVAERARRRGGLDGACAAWERAAELTVRAEPRAVRRYSAARVAWLAGQAGRARALLDAAHRDAAESGLRADIARLGARVEWNTGSMHVGHRMVLQGAKEVAPVDPDRAREMAMFGAALAAFGADSGVEIDPVSLVPPATAADPPRVRCFADLLVGLDHAARGEWAAGAAAIRAGFVAAESLCTEDQDLLPNLGIAALHLGDDKAIRRYHDLLLSRARDTGAGVMILYSLARLGFAQVPAGQWSAAAAGEAEALGLARSTGQPGLAALPLAFLALLAALRADEESYAGHLAAVEEVASTHPLGIVDHLIRDMIRWAKGVRAVAQPATAFQHLAQISHGMIRRVAAISRLEAAARSGHRAEAQVWAQELEAFAAASASPWAAASAAHGEALLCDGEAAGRLFERALQHHDAVTQRPFDRARTELAYGEHLRRQRRRVDARAHLRAALETFDDLGARPWAERARQELRASGETARRREPTATAGLTAQELQVARLVGEGMSNREVAGQLFLSPRTIDFHLRNVYAKLEVTSRAELARLSLVLN